MATSSEWTKTKLNEKDILVPPQGTLLGLPGVTVIYATILSLRKPLESAVESSQRRFVLEPFHVSCFVKCYYDEDSRYHNFFGEDCVRQFLEELGRIGENLSLELAKLNKNSVPVVIHDFTKYASRFILKNLRQTDKLSAVIKKPEDKFYSFAVEIDGRHKFRFFDPCTFLRQPFDEVMEEVEGRKHLEKHLAKNEEQLRFVQDKKNSEIAIPFDFLDGLEKLQLDELPSSFEDKLSAKNPEMQYHKAERAWNVFGCNNLREYIELHGKFQVLSLCDIFEKLRDLCRKQYKLEMLDFKTPATLTWKAMINHINHTGQYAVELLSDIEMIKFVKDNIRGGISQCCKRHAKAANNKYLEPESYNKNEPSTFIIYLDINNAAGYAMSQYLPISDYSWVSGNDFADKQAILNIPENGKYGYIMEVDLHYPHHLGQTHRDLPFCCESKKIEMREGQLKLIDNMNCEKKEVRENQMNKLITNMNCKKNYVIHYRLLQQCLQNGLELKKIHKVLKFRQAPWLASYVDYNTKLRTSAENELEKMFYKLMNNALHGMTHERKHEYFDLIVEEFGPGPASGFATKNCDLINEYSYLRKSEKKNTRYAELVQVGFCIHELIKLRMYDFHYTHMSKRYKKLNLLYMETDSLIYEIETEDFYGDLKACEETQDPILQEFLEEFDTSGLEDPKWGARWKIKGNNKKVVGKFKDEKDGKLIKEFYSTGSKTYYYQCQDEEEVKRLAGVPRYFIDRSWDSSAVHKEDYAKCVNNNEKVNKTYWIVKDDGTDLIMTRYIRIAFSPGDIKRKVVKKIETKPHGYNSECTCVDPNLISDER